MNVHGRGEANRMDSLFETCEIVRAGFKGCLKGIEKTPIEKNFERNNIILVEICSSIQVHWIMFEMFISILFYWNQIEVIQT